MKTDPYFEIRIIPISAVHEAWRASVPVPHQWRNLPGVDGQLTEAGPWLGGEGCSPTAALEALIFKIGRATLGALHWEAMGSDKADT